MRRVGKRYSRVIAAALIASNLFIANALASDVRPRDPSLIDRIKAVVKHVVHTLSDELSVPPPAPKP